MYKVKHVRKHDGNKYIGEDNSHKGVTYTTIGLNLAQVNVQGMDWDGEVECIRTTGPLDCCDDDFVGVSIDRHEVYEIDKSGLGGFDVIARVEYFEDMGIPVNSKEAGKISGLVKLDDIYNVLKNTVAGLKDGTVNMHYSYSKQTADDVQKKCEAVHHYMDELLAAFKKDGPN